MNLLQAHAANLSKLRVGNARPQSRIARTPTPLPLGGYEKGTLHTYKPHAMNNLKNHASYSSVNTTAHFYPLFSQKRPVSGPKTRILT